MNWQQVDVDRNGNGLFMATDQNGDTVFKTVENCQPLIDLNKAERNEGKKTGDLRKVASISPAVWLWLWQEFGGPPNSPENQPRLRKWLNDRDFRAFRTSEARV